MNKEKLVKEIAKIVCKANGGDPYYDLSWQNYVEDAQEILFLINGQNGK